MSADDNNEIKLHNADRKITLFDIESLLTVNRDYDERIVTQQSLTTSQKDQKQQHFLQQNQQSSKRAKQDNSRYKKQQQVQGSYSEKAMANLQKVEKQMATVHVRAPMNSLQKVKVYRKQNAHSQNVHFIEGDFFRIKQDKHSTRRLFLMKRQIQYKNREAKLHEILQKDIEKQKKAEVQRTLKAQQRIKKMNQKSKDKNSKITRWKLYQQYLQQSRTQSKRSNQRSRLMTNTNEQTGLKYLQSGNLNLYPNSSLIQQTKQRQQTLIQRTRQKFIASGSRSKLDGSIYSEPRKKKQQRIQKQRSRTTLSPKNENSKSKQLRQEINGVNQQLLDQEGQSQKYQTIINDSLSQNNTKQLKKFRIFKVQPKQTKFDKRKVSRFDQVFGLKYEQCDALSKIRRKLKRQVKQPQL